MAHGYHRAAGGLKDGPLQARSVFYFRVRGFRQDEPGRPFSFDTAVINHPSMQSAFAALTLCYPGTRIAAIQETEFSDDGLPAVRMTAHYRKVKPKAYA